MFPKIGGFHPQIIHGLIGFSIIFTIHFRGKILYFWKHPIKPKLQVTEACHQNWSILKSQVLMLRQQAHAKEQRVRQLKDDLEA